jgi:cell growth-regulating nucleolar protein
MTEAQKYQGALYKAKPQKGKKQVEIVSPEQKRLQPYVEDAAEYEYGNQVAIVDAPPHAPSPPPSAPPHAVNVFDFLVDDETPNASRVSLGGSKEQMSMVSNAQPLFKSFSASPSPEDQHYSRNGYTYGDEPVAVQHAIEYQTPAPKKSKSDKNKGSKSTDKKRKRQVEELDLSRASRSSQDLDEEMIDADASGGPILHSGLTGGLNRLLTDSTFPPSPDYSNGSGAEPSPLSPAKRKRASNVRLEKRGRYAGQLVKVRKSSRRSSDESRPRKHHRSQRDGSPQARKRSVKAIEYHGDAADAEADNQMVVYQSRAESFLSFVTKGPESTAGYSMNKALKRWHRDRGELGSQKYDEEKELWKSLRLRRNDAGEIVIFVGDGSQ